MVTDRPYRDAMSPEQASTELLRFAGSPFDPAVVRAFLSALEPDEAEAAELATVA